MHCQFAERLAAPKATRIPMVVACVLRSALVQCTPVVLPQLQQNIRHVVAPDAQCGIC